MSRTSDANDVRVLCEWIGCGAHFKMRDGIPEGWTNLLVYSGKPKMNFWDILPKDCFRDTVLCPAHTQLLGDQLKPLGHARAAPAAGRT